MWILINHSIPRPGLHVSTCLHVVFDRPQNFFNAQATNNARRTMSLARFALWRVWTCKESTGFKCCCCFFKSSRPGFDFNWSGKENNSWAPLVWTDTKHGPEFFLRMLFQQVASGTSDGIRIDWPAINSFRRAINSKVIRMRGYRLIIGFRVNGLVFENAQRNLYERYLRFCCIIFMHNNIWKSRDHSCSIKKPTSQKLNIELT